MSKESELIHFLNWFAKQNEMIDESNEQFAEDWVSDYFDTYPLKKKCECIEPLFIKEENGFGEMKDYCCNCNKWK